MSTVGPIATIFVVTLFSALLIIDPSNALDNGVGLTPMLGWMSWMRFRCNVNCKLDPDNCIGEKLFMSIADTMVRDGWKDAGYNFVNIDDCWQADERAADGSVVANSSRFPSGMKALGDYIHSKGLKFGMYSAMGSTTCGGYPALGCISLDNCSMAQRDVATYLSWGIDYIKVDSCSDSNSSNFNTTHPYISKLFLDGAKKVSRPVIYHPSGITLTNNIWKHGPKKPQQYKLYSKIANTWRHYADMGPVWDMVDKIIDYWAADNNETHPVSYENEWEDFLTVSKPGVYQDPDALVAGNVNNSKECLPCNPYGDGTGFCGGTKGSAQQNTPCLCCGTLSSTEELTNFVMWAMFAAPLEIGADIRSIPDTSANILKNVEVIAVNQDPLVYQGRRVYNVNGLQVWKKHLVDDSVAVALYNANTTTASIPLIFEDVGFTDCDRVNIRDLINHTDLGTHINSIVMPSIPSHGVAMLKLTVEW